ncbi:PLP-dependent transferase [Trichoderma novae-zelandiae]
MERFHYNSAVEAFRDEEYPMLQGRQALGSCAFDMILWRSLTCGHLHIDSVYLDHAGSTLCSKSLMDAFAKEMTSVLYGNPHSGSSPSQHSSSRIDQVRVHLLDFFKADPDQYDLVFVANATAGVKLVVEGMRSLPDGYVLAYHQACHTSVVGAREEAQESVCPDDTGVQSWLGGENPFKTGTSGSPATLFAYSAQSHMDGRRYPLSWAKQLKNSEAQASSRTLTLLDAASLSATSQLDLSHPQFAADFVVTSLYKIFGFPDLGVLLVRRSAESIFDQRRYFGGGTVDVVLCGDEQWHAPKPYSLHERLEDGTLPFHSIIAVDMAISTHQRLFGSMDQISAHTAYLSRELCRGLHNLRHANGNPVCHIYSEVPDDVTPAEAGPVVSFNLRDSRGLWIGLAEVEKLAILRNMHVRTGGVCSPAALASALELQPWEMKRNLSAGIRCGEDSGRFTNKPTGIIRASLGAMNTQSDVSRFLAFVQEFFVEEALGVPDQVSPALRSKSRGTPSNMQVKNITVYPIKSCSGYTIPPGVRWGVRPEGLAWDREWCLVHRGSGQALSQKRYPRMALLRPLLLLNENVLRVEYRGTTTTKGQPAQVDISLSNNPSDYDVDFRQTSSRVCGENISAQSYLSEEINSFFSTSLGVPCMLARFPAGGRGASSRLSKARMQKHQRTEKTPSGQLSSFPGVPSPPDSDSEQQVAPCKILLSNESPILMISSSSVEMLNQAITQSGASAVDESVFRANIVIEAFPGKHSPPPYSEDSWKRIRIGNHGFKLLGACQRCQMVCVDQTTGERRQEPFVTLAKTRRLNGKVYFGTHMRHEQLEQSAEPDAVGPTIQVGDTVVVDEKEEEEWEEGQQIAGEEAPDGGRGR